MSTQQVRCSSISNSSSIWCHSFSFVSHFLCIVECTILIFLSVFWNIRSKVRRLRAIKEKIKKRKKIKIFLIIIPISACQRKESSSIKRKYVRTQNILLFFSCFILATNLFSLVQYVRTFIDGCTMNEQTSEVFTFYVSMYVYFQFHLLSHL